MNRVMARQCCKNGLFLMGPAVVFKVFQDPNVCAIFVYCTFSTSYGHSGACCLISKALSAKDNAHIIQIFLDNLNSSRSTYVQVFLMFSFVAVT